MNSTLCAAVKELRADREDQVGQGFVRMLLRHLPAVAAQGQHGSDQVEGRHPIPAPRRASAAFPGEVRRLDGKPKLNQSLKI